jgi:hypothetical protein
MWFSEISHNFHRVSRGLEDVSPVAETVDYHEAPAGLVVILADNRGKICTGKDFPGKMPAPLEFLAGRRRELL